MLRKFGFTSLVILTVTFGSLAGRAFGQQPHMRAALDHLKAARASLNSASHDKGGHRNRAVELVNSAITEVERGIEYGRAH